VSTTHSAALWFIFAAVTEPAFQIAAQAELDRVVGRDAMPTFNDRGRLPYIQAIVNEILRWRPPAPMGLPHYCAEDDYYNGMRIPKGSIVIANSWAMDQDPTVWDQPQAFLPSRWLRADGSIDEHKSYTCFGYGPRVCQGRYVAERTIWIFVAQMLWAFNISDPSRPSGSMSPKEYIYEATATSELLPKPTPFKARFELRDPSLRAVIDTEKARIDDELGSV